MDRGGSSGTDFQPVDRTNPQSRKFNALLINVGRAPLCPPNQTTPCGAFEKSRFITRHVTACLWTAAAQVGQASSLSIEPTPDLASERPAKNRDRYGGLFAVPVCFSVLTFSFVFHSLSWHFNVRLMSFPPLFDILHSLFVLSFPLLPTLHSLFFVHLVHYVHTVHVLYRVAFKS